MLDNSSLEQYLILSKSAKGRAACALIQQAIANPSCFHFGELLDQANISSLDQAPDTKPFLDLLRIFAYGTYADYLQGQAAFPKLEEPQVAKLRMLTVVSLAAENRVINYATLLRDLGLSDTRTLEDLIIEGVYVGLFSGKLDQKRQEFQVEDTAGRDCKPGQLAEMIATLQAWVGASEDISKQLADKISFAEKSQEREAARVERFAARVEDVKKSIQMHGAEMDGGPVPGHSDMSMDMDDVSRPKSRPKTKHPSASHASGRH
mmetsp:Transcript_11994/g.31117  ORF Transcript_11994/g.31117 Transcript_11994/m.31117 type:complete len:263 (-) Transcript_11994:76-864(-)